jgi:hypothetical protein
MKQDTSPQGLIVEAMRSVAVSEAPEGMEQRVAARLREAAAEPHSRKTVVRWMQWRLPLAVSLALLALCAFLFRPAAKVQQPHPQPTDTSSIAEVHALVSLVQPQLPTRLPRKVAVRQQHARPRVAELASYPTPPEPLTPEEKLLLKCVRENQPQVMKALSLIASNNNLSNDSPNADQGDHE